MKMFEVIAKNPIILLLAPVGAVLFSVQLALVVLLILILIDLYYGIRKSFKKKGKSFQPLKRHFWKIITSKGLRKSWVKSTQYGTGILVTSMLQAVFFPTFIISIFGASFTPLLFIIMVACLIESYSIVENLNEVFPNNKLNQMIDWIKSGKVKEIITIFKKNEK